MANRRWVERCRNRPLPPGPRHGVILNIGGVKAWVPARLMDLVMRPETNRALREAAARFKAVNRL